MEPRPWYKKKRYTASLAIAAVVATSSLASSTPTPVAPIVAPAHQPAAASAITPTPTPTFQVEAKAEGSSHAPAVQETKASANVPAAQASTYSSSDAHYYTNVDGQKTQSPTYYDSAPAGASARCGDGTYSFSAHRQGTCSHHGGVAEWL